MAKSFLFVKQLVVSSVATLSSNQEDILLNRSACQLRLAVISASRTRSKDLRGDFAVLDTTLCYTPSLMSACR